jgi:hypothetical protein
MKIGVMLESDISGLGDDQKLYFTFDNMNDAFTFINTALCFSNTGMTASLKILKYTEDTKE